MTAVATVATAPIAVQITAVRCHQGWDAADSGALMCTVTLPSALMWRRLTGFTEAPLKEDSEWTRLRDDCVLSGTPDSSRPPRCPSAFSAMLDGSRAEALVVALGCRVSTDGLVDTWTVRGAHDDHYAAAGHGP